MKMEKCRKCGILFACPECSRKLSEIDEQIYMDRRKSVAKTKRKRVKSQ